MFFALCTLALVAVVTGLSYPGPILVNNNHLAAAAFFTSYQQGGDVELNQKSPTLVVPDGRCDALFETDKILCHKLGVQALKIEVTDETDVEINISENGYRANIYRLNRNSSGLCPGNALVVGSARCGGILPRLLSLPESRVLREM